MKLILHRDRGAPLWYAMEWNEERETLVRSSVLIEACVVDLSALGPHASDTEMAAEVLATEQLYLMAAKIRKLPPIIRRVGTKTDSAATGA